MKLPFSLLIFLFVAPFIQAQKTSQIYVKYKTDYDEMPMNITLELIATPEKATSRATMLFDQEETEKIKKKDGKREVQTGVGLDRIEDTYYNSSSSIIYWTHHLDGKPLLIRDSLPDFHWTILTDVKEIAGFVCHKATTNFRGSRIIAWFTYDIPIPFGPGKFRGLPGLILKAYNPDGPYVSIMTAEKIQYPYAKKVNFVPPKEDYKIISYRKFLKTMADKVKEMMEVQNARMPKNTIISEPRTSRPGIEKKYEWE